MILKPSCAKIEECDMFENPVNYDDTQTFIKLNNIISKFENPVNYDDTQTFRMVR